MRTTMVGRALEVAAIAAMLTACAALRSGAQTEAPPDSAPKAIVPPPAPPRASWVSNRPVLAAGDIVTVIVDEATTARERTSTSASADRSQKATLGAVLDGETAFGDSRIQTGMDTGSRDVGEAARQGGLSGTLSARIVEIAPSGTARIEGTKKITIDGRTQEMTLRGTIRLADVSPPNFVYSSRIADSEISYKGHKMGPRLGIIGKILSIVWP